MGSCGVRGEGAAAPSPQDVVSLAFGLVSRLWDPQQVPAGRMESKGTVLPGLVLTWDQGWLRTQAGMFRDC